MTTLELACSADEAYLPHVSAMLHSALTHTKQRPLRIWLVHGKPLSTEGRARVDAVVAAFGAELVFLPIPDAALDGFSLRHFHPACWYRILLPDFLPDIERIVYLDADVIATDDLAPLWNMPLDGKLFAAACNPLFPLMRNWPLLDLGLADPLDYLNSGVLLMDLAAMRTDGTVEKLRRYSVQHPDRLLPEQDALSAVSRGQWLRLPPRWNAQTTHFDLRPDQLPDPRAELRDALARPAVIHYNGPFKPWQYLCKHPRRELYFEHLRQTPWPVRPLQGDKFVYRILRPLPISLQYQVFELRLQWHRLRKVLRNALAEVR